MCWLLGALFFNPIILIITSRIVDQKDTGIAALISSQNPTPQIVISDPPVWCLWR
jgi:hypothetical protein